MRTRCSTVLTMVAVALLGACGGDADTVLPSAEDAASALLSPADLDGHWTVSAPPEGSPAEASGVVTDEMADLLPEAELCDAASTESVAAWEAIRWLAFRQLDATVDDPLDPPTDTTGHLVFIQEFLAAGDPDELEQTFELVAEGLMACLGELPAGDEGPGTAVELSLPEVGDQRVGVLTTVAEAGGGAEWRLHSALVRQGDVLASIVVVDIRGGEAEPLFTDVDIATIVTTAVDRL